MADAIYLKGCKTIVAGTEGFQGEVVGYLDTIGGTGLGGTMLEYFSAAAPSKLVKSPHEQVALVILQFGLKNPDTNAPVCTKTCIDWAEQTAFRPQGLSNADFLKAQKIPLIRIPAWGWKQKAPGKLEVKAGVLLGHDDFSKAGVEMDVVLFHEMCHAYLIAAGISRRWDGRKFPKSNEVKSIDKIGLDVAVEEQIVCGLLYGRGLDGCENAYRRQRKLSARLSYKAVGLAVDRQLEANFDDTWNTAAGNLAEGAKLWGSKIAYVLSKNGYPGDTKKDFGDARQVTDLGLLEKAVEKQDEAPKLEKKKSSLGLDATQVDGNGDVTLS
ncbi:MAG: hypothetical protein MUF34_15100 [Polyangiaceae bacterium]|jgi:hypothetical protein|nr:hypothetical protein [Polyangiaceae bacterium]